MPSTQPMASNQPMEIETKTSGEATSELPATTDARPSFEAPTPNAEQNTGISSVPTSAVPSTDEPSIGCTDPPCQSIQDKMKDISTDDNIR